MERADRDAVQDALRGQIDVVARLLEARELSEEERQRADLWDAVQAAHLLARRIERLERRAGRELPAADDAA